jgi:hypothetical protein
MSNSPREPSEFVVEGICRRFEDALKNAPSAKQRPRVEEFLSEAPESLRARLLLELVGLDVDYRRGQNEAPSAYEYRVPTANCRASGSASMTSISSKSSWPSSNLTSKRPPGTPSRASHWTAKLRPRWPKSWACPKAPWCKPRRACSNGYAKKQANSWTDAIFVRYLRRNRPSIYGGSSAAMTRLP